MALINASPVTRSVVNEQLKEVKFNGSSDFPMEFIKKLTEHEHYHDINNIAWVSRHLEGACGRRKRHRRRYRPKNLGNYGVNQLRQGRKPGRDWAKNVDSEMVPANQPVDYKNIYLRIKEKGRKRTEQINLANKITKFQVCEKVLLRAYPMSDLNKRAIGKFCNIFEGPYKVSKEVGVATYQLEDIQQPGRIRGKFNIRQLNPYYEI